MMKYFLTLLATLILSATVFAVPAELEPILIVELQTGSIDSASDEFVEIYNPNDADIDMSGWLVQYKSATGANWSTKVEIDGTILARGRYLFASNDYLVDDA